ncbi:MAG: hypothetical protein OES84_00185 [Kiritimatiellaceae bacterium]|nr:hypothetical protein [Kiritimatiellaceae bacterium]
MSHEFYEPEVYAEEKSIIGSAARDKVITCDQVVWIMNVFDRYLPCDKVVSASMKRDITKYAMLYEVMEAAGLSFEDEKAVHNATPAPVRINL